MLDANLKSQLTGYLGRLTRPIELVAHLDTSETASEMRALLADIASCSEQVHVSETSDASTRSPSFAVRSVGEDARVAFAGMPLGHEFTSLVLALLQVGGYPPKVDAALIEQIKNIQAMLFNEETEWAITKVNVFDLNIEGVTAGRTPFYEEGRIRVGRVLKKDGMDLPVSGGFKIILDILQKEKKLGPIINALRAVSAQYGPIVALSGLEALEVLLKDGWISGYYSSDQPLLRSSDIPRTPNIDWNKDTEDPMVRLAQAISA